MLTTRTITNAGAPLYSPSGDLLVGTSIVFWLADSSGRQTDAWDATTKERVGGDPITAVTDAQGEFSVDLWPNSRGNRPTRYKCRVQSDGFREFAGVVDDVVGDLSWVDFMLSGGTMEAQDISAISAAIAGHVATPDPHTQYAKESDLGAAAGLDVGTAAGTVAAGDDPRLSDARPPTGAAGGVLSGSYPNPGFAVDMATQAELDLVSSAKVDKVAGKGLSTEDYSTAEKNKLAGVATGATANSSDAALRDRSTHTGAQAISTVTGLQGALDAKAPLASPALTGVPSAPTAAVGTNTTQIATTEYVFAERTNTATLTNKTLTSPIFNDGYTEEVFAVTGTAPALSPTNGSIQTWMLSGNSTPTADTWASGQSLTLMVDDGSAYTINWASLSITWKTGGGTAPTLLTSGYTVIELVKVGSAIYGWLAGDA